MNVPQSRLGRRSSRFAKLCVWLSAGVLSLGMIGCSTVPSSGFLRSDVEQKNTASLARMQVVDIDESVASQIAKQKRTKSFAEAFTTSTTKSHVVSQGDALEVSIWEAPPAALFGGGSVEMVRGANASARATTLPEQVVSVEGTINVPFAGRIDAAGRTLQAIEADIAKRLTGKANQPEAIVRLTRNASANVTVVGEVTNSTRLPLSPSGEKLLDALAAAGGVRQSVNKMTIQVTRGDIVQAMPLDAIIRDPKQNVALVRGDVVTALFQPLSFIALGATGKNEEISFETQGISLAQALARTGGLRDERSDPQGVFIFRFEEPKAMAWPKQPVVTTADGKVAVIYRLNLRDPAAFFAAQNFQMSHRDVLYVSNSPVAELQKFLNVLFSIAYPIINVAQITR